MTVNSYEMILRAFGGTVAWGEYTNLIGTATMPFGSAADSVEFYTGFGGGEILPPGDYLLGRIQLTPLSGSPIVAFANSSRLNPPGYTSFGTACPGLDEDNTAKLGSDWMDADGLPGAGASTDPILSPVPDQTVAEGRILEVWLSAYDADGSLLTLLVSPSLRFATYRQTLFVPGHTEGSLRLMPQADDVGEYTIIVSASDGLHVAEHSVHLTVTGPPPPIPPDFPPTFSTVPPFTVQPGSFKEFAVSATDPEGALVTVSLIHAPTFVTLLITSQTPSGTECILRAAAAESDVGDWRFGMTASDGTRLAAQSLWIIVGPNHSPEPAPVTAMHVLEMESLSNMIIATDPDHDVVHMDVVDAPDFVTITSKSESIGYGIVWFTLHPVRGDAGTHSIGLVMSDGIAQVGLAVPIQVFTSGIPGVTWSPASIGCVEQGRSRYLGVKASDPEGRPLSLELTQAPAWVTIAQSTPNTLLMGMAPPPAEPVGPYTIWITAIDPAGNRAPHFFEGELTPVGTCYCVPCLSVPPPPTAVAGSSYRGYAGIPIRFDGRSSATGYEPARFNWTFGDGSAHGGSVVEHVYERAGAYPVTLQVSNSGGSSRDTTVAIVADAIPARAFSYPIQRVVALRDSKGHVGLRVEPSEIPFDVTGLRLETATLRADGLGECDSIAATSPRHLVLGDSDENGAPDAGFEFSMGDLRRLFSTVRGKRDVQARLEVRTAAGVLVRGDLALTVLGTPSRAITVGPNPFNPSGSIRFEVASPGLVRVRLFDLSGRLLKTLVDERVGRAGPRVVNVDGRDGSGRPLASGVYFFRVERDGQTDRGRVTLLK